MHDALKIDRSDNVAVTIRLVEKGEEVVYNNYEDGYGKVVAVTNIPIFHKIALKDMKTKEKIIKYGEHIGEASCDIRAGEHVHTQNVASVRENLRENGKSI